jgi:transposase
MYRPYDQGQSFLLPPSLRDFVSEDHPAHVINDLVDQLDLSVLEAHYTGTWANPHTIHG